MTPLSILLMLLAVPAGAENARPAPEILKDLPENTWVRALPDSAGPWKRNYSDMCFDTRKGRVLSWGGGHFSYPGNEVQAWTVGAGRWAALDDRCVPPLAVRWVGGMIPGEVCPHGRPTASHSYGDLLYDPVGHQMIWMRLGGYRVWLYDLATKRWRQKAPADNPPSMLAACCAYVSDGRLVAAVGPSSDYLHLYDIAKGAWTSKVKLPERPYNSAMTYDPRSKRLVLVGGRLKDAWSYSLTDKKWRKTDREGSPVGVHSVAAVYDSANNAVIVVGCERTDRKKWRNRTWVLDTAAGTWSDPKPKAVPTIALAGLYGSGVYDPKHNLVIATWGKGWRGRCETWVYRYRATGKEPVPKATVVTPPSIQPRTPPAKRPTGQGAPAPGEGWVRVNPGDPPQAPWYRGLSGAVYCDKAERVFFFGAGFANSAGSKPYAELYDPAANTWEKVGPPKGRWGPPLTTTFAMLAYDHDANRVIYPYTSPAADRSSTWAFDVAKRKWAELKCSTQPRVVPQSAAVYDRRNKVVVLFGGSYDGGPQTWLFDTTKHTWRKAQPKTSPSARNWHNMVYDAAAGAVVLYGGHDGKRELADTWLYDAAKSTWTQVIPRRPGPPPRCGHGMAFDAGRGKTVLFGGHTTRFNDEADEEAFLYQKSHSDLGVAHGDTWAFDAAARTWTKLAPKASPPPARIISGAMVYDSRRNQLMHDAPVEAPIPGVEEVQHLPGMGPARQDRGQEQIAPAITMPKARG